ncbi:HIT family protein [Candidatus Poribacteria bacterium]|nr:HIT family protein [Candidatus Poribacteria bacterium]
MVSIFTQIVNGDIPCHKVLEDDQYLAFLDINPTHPGHTLVITKQEIDYIFDLEDNLLSGLMVFSKKVGAAIKKATHCRRIGVVVAGYEVPHTHVHLIPTNSMSDFNFALSRRADQEELAVMATKIQEHL